MSTDKHECCNGCKNGQPGQNKDCKAKHLLEQLKAAEKERVKNTTPKKP